MSVRNITENMYIFLNIIMSFIGIFQFSFNIFLFSLA